MAEALQTAFGVEAELIKGDGGVFDVIHEGDLIYSKFKTERFPDNREVVKTISERTA